MLDRILENAHFSEKVGNLNLRHHPCHKLSKGSLSMLTGLQESVAVMVDVLHAVQYIHEVGLVHRDLKVERPSLAR